MDPTLLDEVPPPPIVAPPCEPLKILPGDEALACVRWDGTVDMRRLLRAEFAYNLDIVKAALGRVHRAGHVLALFAGGGSHHVLIERCDAGRWTAGGAHYDDHDIACLVVARAYRPDSALITYIGSTALPINIEWRYMWLAVVADDIASRSGAWDAMSMMATLHLARCLSELIRVRLAGDVTSVGDDRLDLPDLAHGLGVMSQIDAAHGLDRASRGLARPDEVPAGACKTRAVLDTLANAIQRLYDTPAIYLAHIAPAEYDSLREAMPPGAFT
ncbi:hypothetical protein pqer_cds_384 [Pandoravirus quercus]|uniref:Uncharacterized protein n=1 Tax=Pandoravirus quercus TaxID=2107709 RepID=A0A2U7U8P9_9VIRU|nr:hypothetical protein pqer_cds_384 [Pandoravirus quercus]AVK74806.1 hypothetical protein pqer_cds_384 [Pandoravirus quercus]